MELFELSHTTPPAGSDTELQFNNSGVFGASSELVWDNVNKRLGLGTGTPGSMLELNSNTTARIHIKAGTSGASIHSSSRLVIEDNTIAYLQFLTPNNFKAGIKFGDPQGSESGKVEYNHDTDDLLFESNVSLSIRIAGSPRWRATVAGSIFNEGGSPSNDLRIEGGGKPYLFFLDAGQDTIGMGGVTDPDETLEVLGNIHLSTDNDAVVFGTASNGDASIYYDGTDMVVNPKVVGSGVLSILGGISLLDEDIILGTTTGTKIGTSTSQKLGFFNVTPVVQPTALTSPLTQITHTAPGTPDYAIQDMTTTTPYGFVTQDEANTVLSVILNLQTRVDELETKQQALGVIA